MENIIIIGSSSGFGLKVVMDFVDKGYQVFVMMCQLDGKNVEKKVVLEVYFVYIKVVEMDVMSDDVVKKVMDYILVVVGDIDIFINNVGIMYIGIIEVYSVEQACF